MDKKINNLLADIHKEKIKLNDATKVWMKSEGGLSYRETILKNLTEIDILEKVLVGYNADIKEDTIVTNETQIKGWESINFTEEREDYDDE